jgi:FkbM family methyltransferase
LQSLSAPRTIPVHDRDRRWGAERLKDAVRRVVPRATRNWLRSPSKSAEWLWDSTRFFLGNTESLEISPNSSLVCHPRAYKVFRRDQVDDPEQSAEFRGFVSHCSSAMSLFDIGAHFGIFSLAAANFGGKAVAVDASPAATHMIGVLANLNRCTDRVQILCAAVSDANSALDMLNSGVFSDGYFKATRQRPKSELTRVEAVTVDRMALQFGAPTHIKIDVEGHEAAVLRGARATLGRFSPILFLELHNEMVVSGGDNPTAALDELAQSGYDAFALNGDAIGTSAILARPIIRIVAKRRVG